LEEFGGQLPAEVYKRARHVVEEIARVQQACYCLAREDAAGLAA
jgi:galactokinase